MTIAWTKRRCMECDMITEAVNRKRPTLRQLVGREADVAEAVEMFVVEFKRVTGLPPNRELHFLRLIKQPWMPLTLLKKPFRRVVTGIPPDPIASTDPMANARAGFAKGVDTIPPGISLDMTDLDADIRAMRILLLHPNTGANVGQIVRTPSE